MQKVQSERNRSVCPPTYFRDPWTGGFMSLLRAVSRNPTPPPPPPPRRNRKGRRRVLELGNPDLGLLSQEMREGPPVTCSSPENRFYPFRVPHVVRAKSDYVGRVRYVEGGYKRGWSVIAFDAHPVTREVGVVLNFPPTISRPPSRRDQCDTGLQGLKKGFLSLSLSFRPVIVLSFLWWRWASLLGRKRKGID